MRRWRQYLSSAGATIAVFLMTSLAFAGPWELPEQANEKAEEMVSKEKAEVEEPEVETQEVEEEEGPGALQEGDDVVNHGHCVSYWARQSKELKGRARGEFISSIARNPEAVSNKVEEGGQPDATHCDYSDELEAAKSSASATSNGKGKGNGRGRPEGASRPDSGS